MGGFTEEPVNEGQFNRPMQFNDLPMQVQEQIAVQMSGSRDPQRISLTLSMIQADPMIGEQAMRLLPTAGAGQQSSFSQMPPQLPSQAPPEAMQLPQNMQRPYNAPQGGDGFGQLPPLPPGSPEMGSEFSGDDGFGVKEAVLGAGATAAAVGAGVAGKKIYDAKKAPPPQPTARPSPVPSRGRNPMVQGQTPAPKQMELPLQEATGQMDLPFPGDETVGDIMNKIPGEADNVAELAVKPGTAAKVAPRKGKPTTQPFPNDQAVTPPLKQVKTKQPSKPIKPPVEQPKKTTKAWSDTPKDFTIVDIQGEDQVYYTRKDNRGVDRYYTKNKAGELTHVGNRKEQVLKHASKGATEKTKPTKKKAAPVEKKALTSKKQINKKPTNKTTKKAVKKSRANAKNTKKAKNIQSKEAASAVETAAKKDYLTAPERAKATTFEHGGYTYHAKQTPDGIKIYRKNGQLAGASVQKRAMKAATSAVGSKIVGKKGAKNANAIRKARPNPTKAQQEAAKGASVAGKNAAKAAANAKKRAARAAAKAVK